MLYGTKAESRHRGPRSVWPWFFCGILFPCLIGLAFLTTWPGDIPAESELVSVGGPLKTSRVRDDLSDSYGGAVLPVFTSVYMRFEGDEHEYRYPWHHAQYFYVREYTFVNVEIWVREEDLNKNDGKPVMIWALEEHNPFEPAEDQTIVTYQEGTAQLNKNIDSLMNLSKWLGSGSVIFLVIGFWTMHWNRRNYPEYVSPSQKPE